MVRVQLEMLGLGEAEKDIQLAILSVCAAFQIPNHLTVEQLLELGGHNSKNLN